MKPPRRRGESKGVPPYSRNLRMFSPHWVHSLSLVFLPFWAAEWRGLKEINLCGKLAYPNYCPNHQDTVVMQAYICSGWKVLENSKIQFSFKRLETYCWQHGKEGLGGSILSSSLPHPGTQPSWLCQEVVCPGPPTPGLHSLHA